MEKFGIECVEDTEDGRVLLQTGYSNKENLISWILSMGDEIELLEPVELRRDLKRVSRNIFRKYE